VKGTFFDN